MVLDAHALGCAGYILVLPACPMALREKLHLDKVGCVFAKTSVLSLV